jgi:uncharacterized protein (TIGR02391 family)
MKLINDHVIRYSMSTNPSFAALFPDVEVLVALSPEALGDILLPFFNSLPHYQRQSLRYSTFCSIFIINVFDPKVRDRVTTAVREAWVVLVRDGFLAQTPDSYDSYFITKRGASVTSSQDMETYRKASLLPHIILFPDLAAEVLLDFNQGNYDTAIFKAFKHVEVSVRAAGGFTNADIGTKLMRQAFGSAGPLTDTSVVAAEQQAVADLFAGAIGAYKNPPSHRYVLLNDPAVAVELILYANHLLRIVRERVAAGTPPP